MSSRIRISLQKVQSLYDTGEDRSKLVNLIRAFRGIQDLHTTDERSFWCLAGYHGEPFRGKGATDPTWWGGYCNHANVLFPTWHRAYLLRFENALRSIPGCEDVTLPFWDELVNHGSGTLDYLPTVLTSPTFDLDGRTDNPLYSYKLQQAIVDNLPGSRYTKPENYRTVRFPLSGLVGTEADIAFTEYHNSTFADPVQNAAYLNGNVGNWLDGTVNIVPDPAKTPTADTYSVYSRFMRCLSAPNYTVFSNTTSQKQWTKENKEVVFSLESPHNGIHLALGGFYQVGQYNANPIFGANGDMGANEMAGFDPIFFLHHAFIDYVFWMWQKKNNQITTGSLTIIPGYPGTVQEEGMPNIVPGTVLTDTTPLYPFTGPGRVLYTSRDMTDIRTLGYSYGVGSLDSAILPDFFAYKDLSPITMIKRVHNINRSKIAGSFVIRTYATTPSGKTVEVGRDAILGRWNTKGCKNCQNFLDEESLVPIDQTTLEFLQEDGKREDVKFSVAVETGDPFQRFYEPIVDDEKPIIDDVDLST